MSNRQSYYSSETPHKCIFRETFNNEFETVQNGGDVNGVTFENGEGVFNGSTSGIVYRKSFSGTFSVRIKFNVEDDNQLLVDYRGTDDLGNPYLYITTGTGSLTYGSGNVYINGVLQTGTPKTISFGVDQEIVITGINIEVINDFYIGSSIAFTNAANGTIGLFEIYEGTLTAEEVSNLYNNKRYVQPSIDPVLHITGERGLVEDLEGNSFTNTDVDIVRDGDVWAMDFNGSTSLITTSDTIFPNGSFTINAWIKFDEVLNDDFVLVASSPSTSFYLRKQSNGNYRNQIYDGSEIIANSFLVDNDLTWGLYTVTYNSSTKTLTSYKNGVLQNTSTNTSFTSINGKYFNIGGYSGAGALGCKGFINDVKIIDNEVWSAQKVSQYYTSTKHKYSK